jgi:hypothetical protein
MTHVSKPSEIRSVGVAAQKIALAAVGQAMPDMRANMIAAIIKAETDDAQRAQAQGKPVLYDSAGRPMVLQSTSEEDTPPTSKIDD